MSFKKIKICPVKLDTSNLWFISKILEENPRDVALWNVKGFMLYELGRYEEALECFDKILEIDPKFVIAWYYKGCTFLMLRRYEDALECFNKALAMGNDPELRKIPWIRNSLPEIRRIKEELEEKLK